MQSWNKKGYHTKHGVKHQRKFDGKSFKAETSARTKSHAKEVAKGLRERGYNVRTIKARKSGHYVLYTDWVGSRKRRKRK